MSAALLPGPVESEQDIIVEVRGQVKSVGFADLDGDGLQDLVVMAVPGPEEKKVPPLQVFFQGARQGFTEVSLPWKWLDHRFLLDLGNYAESPGQEILIADDNDLQVIQFDAERKPTRCGAPTALKTLFYARAHPCPFLLDVSTDIDGNGYDEAILPTSRGHAVLFGRSSGLFREPRYLPGEPEWSIQFSENTLFSVMTMTSKVQPILRVGETPMLVSEREGRILAYLFDEGSDAFCVMKSEEADYGSYAKEAREGTIEYSGIVFSDVKGRSYPYLVQSHRQGTPGLLADLKTTHTVYDFSVDVEKKAVYLDARQRIVTEGIAAAPIFSDLNQDGHLDLILLYVKTSFLSKLLELLLDRVVITCQVHLHEPEENRFAFTPEWSDDISVPVNSYRVVGMEGLVQFHCDYSGDGRPDLVVYDSDRLLIKRGERDQGFFSTREVAFRDRPFYQIAGPFPGPVTHRNVDLDPCPEIVTFGESFIRIVHVR